MSDYYCEHGGMAMGRDCAQCKADKARPLPTEGTFKGREPGAKRLTFRTVVDHTYGGTVIYQNGKTLAKHKIDKRCERAEWWAFIDAEDRK